MAAKAIFSGFLGSVSPRCPACWPWRLAEMGPFAAMRAAERGDELMARFAFVLDMV